MPKESVMGRLLLLALIYSVLLVFSVFIAACATAGTDSVRTLTPPTPTQISVSTSTPDSTSTAAPIFTPLPPDLLKLRSKFGPWFPPRIDEEGRPLYHYTRLLLLYKDGSIEVSTWSMRARDDKWSPSAPPEISSVIFDIEAENVQGDAETLRIIYEGNEFALGIWQPFALESNPLIIYVFGPDGTLWGVNLLDSYKLKPLR